MNKQILVLVFYVLTLTLNGQTSIKNVQFYGHDISINSSVFGLADKYKVKKRKIHDVCNIYEDLCRDQTVIDLSHLFIQSVDSLKLNDWEAYLLAKFIAEEVFADNFRGVILTSKLFDSLGIANRIRYSKNKAFLEVLSSVVPEFSNYQRDRLGVWVHLYTINKNVKPSDYYTCKLNNYRGRPFRFPVATRMLFNDNEQMLLTYRHSELRRQIKIEVSQHEADLLSDYPILPIVEYFNNEEFPELPILDQVREALPVTSNGLDTIESLRLLLSISRTLNEYKEDDFNEGAMGVQSFILADNSDCEDRTIFLHYLIKRLIDLPMIVIRYNGHVNLGVDIGVALNNKQYVLYDGVKYLILEPSQEENVTDIGVSYIAKTRAVREILVPE